MAISAKLLLKLVPAALAIQSQEELIRHQATSREPSQWYVLDPGNFVRRVTEDNPESMPCDWSLTSDSIAAAVCGTGTHSNLHCLSRLLWMPRLGQPNCRDRASLTDSSRRRSPVFRRGLSRCSKQHPRVSHDTTSIAANVRTCRIGHSFRLRELTQYP